jgi:peptidoglycan/LPS O-acetylase OafA/YrhL
MPLPRLACGRHAASAIDSRPCDGPQEEGLPCAGDDRVEERAVEDDDARGGRLEQLRRHPGGCRHGEVRAGLDAPFVYGYLRPMDKIGSHGILPGHREELGRGRRRTGNQFPSSLLLDRRRIVCQNIISVLMHHSFVYTAGKECMSICSLAKLENRNIPNMPLNIISKYRAPLYGFAILWVVVFHAGGSSYGLIPQAPQPLQLFIDHGNVGVDIFLFLSGVCLYFSYVKDPDVGHFMKKRFTRLLIPVAVIDGVYWFVRYVILDWSIEAPIKFLVKLSTLEFWFNGNNTIWFVSAIMIMYFAYPYVYAFLFSKSVKHRASRGMVLVFGAALILILASEYSPGFFDMYEKALCRFPVFLFGCLMGKYVYEKRQVPWWVGLVAVAISIFFISGVFEHGVHSPYRRYLWGIGGVALSYALCLAFVGLSKLHGNGSSAILRFLSWTGGFSLELYLSHIVIRQIYRSFVVPDYLAHPEYWPIYAAFMVLAFIIAWAVGKYISKPLSNRILKHCKSDI